MPALGMQQLHISALDNAGGVPEEVVKALIEQRLWILGPRF
jgi:hypothetical protein